MTDQSETPTGIAIRKMREEIEAPLWNKIEYLTGALRTVVAIAKRDKLTEVYGIAQAGLDLAEHGPEGCAEMRGEKNA